MVPALKDSAFWRIAALCILYVAQGVPFGLFSVSIPSWLATQGYSTAEVATFIGIAGLPWSFKFFAGPVMDRFSFLSMGHRRPWILVAQMGIVLSFLLLSAAYPFVTSIYAVAFLGFLINFFCASQDVAVDGMAIGVLENDERGKANAFMFGGQLAGIAAGSSGGGYLLNYLGMVDTALIGALVTFAIFLVPVAFKERNTEKRFPWSEGSVTPEIAALKVDRILPMVGRLVTVLIVPLSLLLISAEAISRIASGIVYAYLPTFTVQDLGWADTAYNDWYARSNIIAAAVGVAFGPLVDRFGAARIATLGAGLKVLALAVIALFPAMWNEAAWAGFIIVFTTAGQIFSIAVIATFMRICSRDVAASQFAIYMASSNLAYAGGALILGAVGSFTTISEVFVVLALVYVAVPFAFIAAMKRIEANSVLAGNTA